MARLYSLLSLVSKKSLAGKDASFIGKLDFH